MYFVFLFFLIWATDTKISVEIRKCDQPTDQRTNLDMEVLETLACLKIGCTFDLCRCNFTKRGPRLTSKVLRESERKLPPQSSRFCSRENEARISRLHVTLWPTIMFHRRCLWCLRQIQNFRFEKEAFCKSKQHLSWYMKSISSIWGHTSDTNLIWVIKAGFCSVLYRKERKPGRLNGRNSIHSPRSSSPSTVAENVQAFNNVWAHFYQGAQLPAVAICRPVVQGLTEKLPSWQTSEKMHFISLQHVLAFTFLNILKEC